MTGLQLKAAEACGFDLISLGEVMLRFDPGEFRIHTARSFRVFEGGAEYNVARALRRCFGFRTAIVTALVDNPVGRLVEDLMLQGGVDLSYVYWAPFDGIGFDGRNGLNFVERGFGGRPALGCSDRGHTAASQMSSIDWVEILGRPEGAVRWLHTGGVFAALSMGTPDVASEGMQAARRYGTRVSYDLNYRASLWRNVGGKEEAQAVNRRLMQYVDVLFGNEEDFVASLGVDVGGSVTARDLVRRVVDAHPSISTVVLRTSRGSNGVGWGATAYHVGEYYEAAPRDVEIFDRVGGGDAFAAGFLYGLSADKGAAWALECGLAHGALAMSTPGDTSMATFGEVLRAMSGAGVRIDR